MSGYQLCAETALMYLLGSESPSRIVFVPGFRGSGKSRHVLPHIQHVFRDQAIALNISARNKGAKAFGKYAQMSAGKPIALIDNASALGFSHAQQRGIFQQAMTRHLNRKDAKAVLFGGGYQSPGVQFGIMTEALGRVLDTDIEVSTVPLQLKPLNSLQAYGILCATSKLTKAENLLYL